jgi:hypothetical protein
MAYTRILPETDDSREGSITTSKERKDTVPPEDNVFSEENSDSLDAEQPKFIQCRKDVEQAKEADHNAVVAFEYAINLLKTKSSHGLQLINFLVDDGDTGFTPATRELYGMDLSGHLPPYSSEELILLMADNFINGETARVAGGGTGLTDISKATVVALKADALEKRGVKQATGNVLSHAHTELNNQRIMVDALIPKLWDDIEHAAQGMPEGERHDFCISWGMHFVHVPGTAKLFVRAEDIDTHQILVGVDLRIGKPEGTGGAKSTTNFHGEAFMVTKNFEPTSLIAEHPLYERLITPITLAEDEVIDLVMKMKKRPTD